MGRVESMTTPSRDLYFYFFAALKLGLQAVAKTPFASWPASRTEGRIERMKDVITEPPDHQHSTGGQFRRVNCPTWILDILTLYVSNFAILNHRKIVVTLPVAAFSPGFAAPPN